MIRNQSTFFDKPFDKILWVSRFKQGKLQEQLKHLNMEFIHNAIPTMQDIQKKRGSARQLLVVLDDLMELVTKSDVVSGLFTHGSHINVSVLYLT